MKKYLILLVIFTACDSKKIPDDKENVTLDCNDKWNFEGSNVIEKQINDTVTQEIIDGKIWFEIISPKDIGKGITKAYIKNYRMDGTLLSEGFAEYNEHPVANSKESGKWKFYDCKGNLIRINEFK
ncbi:hypothetical protein [Flavobacterium sangjuense]|uniref:Uncharacterized protein n=1 Tax=Flavobacterium sangjuense TaxID=2518177 RepID=A0A4P7PQR4_9FLAO|nr:hypothetical protein [Flavobacterium sangjuense]QBZ96836.1 hypothetical protein GS03_00318 [Flavobacterium sangjuense]